MLFIPGVRNPSELGCANCHRQVLDHHVRKYPPVPDNAVTRLSTWIVLSPLEWQAQKSWNDLKNHLVNGGKVDFIPGKFGQLFAFIIYYVNSKEKKLQGFNLMIHLTKNRCRAHFF